jgi:hypothetical protein
MSTTYAEGEPVYLVPHGDHGHRMPGHIEEIRRNADGRFHCYMVRTANYLYYADLSELEPRDLGPSVWVRFLKPEV